jgi:hypothetical protein
MMNTTIKSFLALAIALFAFNSVDAQKKVKAFKIAKVMDLSAESVWEVVAVDYGRIAQSHPKIINSEYINGTLKAGEGAQRVCYFNEKGSQYLKETMLDFNPSEMTFTNQVDQAGKFPVDPEYTRAIYSVEDLGNGKSRLTFDMEFRTKPAMMGGMMKRSFSKLIEDYFIAIEHHIRTGEAVTKENFKEVKKQYES